MTDASFSEDELTAVGTPEAGSDTIPESQKGSVFGVSDTLMS